MNPPQLHPVDRRTGDYWGLDGSAHGVLHRFGIQTLAVDVAAGTMRMAMPVAGLRNPLTGRPTVAALAVLVDAAAGAANHFRRHDNQWTVTSELGLELDPESLTRASADPAFLVVADAAVDGFVGKTARAECQLRSGDLVLGRAWVRSYYIDASPELHAAPVDPLVREANTTLAELMSVEDEPNDVGTPTLRQCADPALLNAIGVVNGGVSATALELVASAAIDTAERPLWMGSLQVNFLKGLVAGKRARYEGTALHNGRGTAVADGRALGDDGSVAVAARLTGYR